MKRILITGITLCWMWLSGCVKDDTLIIKPIPVVVTKTLSFAKDLDPLLTANCAVSGCHATGGHNPNLMPDKAYNSLIAGKYVDTHNPTGSIIYERLTGVLSPAMPMGRTPNPGNIDGIVLAWIKQGAKDN
ncbi:MAG: hypothetical protein ACHQRM_08535 [Bacteroidia bacterium]